MAWIMIIFMYTHSKPMVVTVEFNDKAQCESVLQDIRNSMESAAYIKYAKCVSKG